MLNFELDLGNGDSLLIYCRQLVNSIRESKIMNTQISQPKS